MYDKEPIKPKREGYLVESKDIGRLEGLLDLTAWQRFKLDAWLDTLRQFHTNGDLPSEPGFYKIDGATAEMYYLDGMGRWYLWSVDDLKEIKFPRGTRMAEVHKTRPLIRIEI